MGRSIACFLVVIVVLATAGNVFGGTILISGNAGDGTVDVNGESGNAALSLRVGSGGNNLRGNAAILLFALPTVSPASITDAQLSIGYLGISQFTVTTVPEFNADLFGIGARSTPTILGTDYYDGNAAGSTDTLITQGFITSSTAVGNLQVSNAGLLNFIKSLYNPDGTPTAAFVAFRVNADIDLPIGSGPYRGYEVASAENTDNGGAFVPQLSITVVPEPSSMALVAIGSVLLGAGVIRRRMKAAKS